jgi:hypothetical protein
MPVVRVPAADIVDWSSFHDVFVRLLGLPSFYGRNMNAWIDCLTSVDEPDARLTNVAVASGDVLTLEIDDVDDLARRCPEQYEALVECVAFVNWRRLHGPRPRRAIVALSFYESPP